VPRELRGKLEPAEVFHEVLEHRWYMAERAGHDIPIEDAIDDYVRSIRAADQARRKCRARASTPILLAMGLPTDSYVDEFGMTQTTGGDSGLAITGGVLIGLGILISIAITIWNRIFKMGRTGQSVGKKVIGLKLIDDKTGQPIGAGMCFLREVVSNIVNQLIYLSYLWMLWDDNKQTLADKAVHSTVVVVPKG
jgi:uncharacterized RDD family membrane protein YckC